MNIKDFKAQENNNQKDNKERKDNGICCVCFKREGNIKSSWGEPICERCAQRLKNTWPRNPDDGWWAG